MTVRLDRFQKGLVAALAGRFGSTPILWAYQEKPKGAEDFIMLRLTSGLSPDEQLEQSTFLPAETATVRITDVVEGERLVVTLNGFDYRHDVASGETDEEIRDDLLAQITAGETGAVTAAADSTDGISITADFLGGIRALELHGEGLELDTITHAENAVQATIERRTGLLSIEAFSKGTSLRAGASAIIDEVLDILREEDVDQMLDRYGIGLWEAGKVNDLSGLAGGHWETRAIVDITVAIKGVRIEALPVIEEANVTVTVGDDQTVTASATAP